MKILNKDYIFSKLQIVGLVWPSRSGPAQARPIRLVQASLGNAMGYPGVFLGNLCWNSHKLLHYCHTYVIIAYRTISLSYASLIRLPTSSYRQTLAVAASCAQFLASVAPLSPR